MADILLDENMDIRIENGDLVLGDGRLQRAQLRLITAPGNLRHAPLVGADIQRQAGGLEIEVLRIVKRECDAEGVDYRLLMQ